MGWRTRWGQSASTIQGDLLTEYHAGDRFGHPWHREGAVRRIGAVWAMVLLLAVAAAPRAAAQDQQAARDPAVQTSPALATPSDTTFKVRKPSVGPRLPDYVRSVSAMDDAKPAAPRGNIVIPVTTALIVLAALVVILLVT
jgi:hypothetical protein